MKKIVSFILAISILLCSVISISAESIEIVPNSFSKMTDTQIEEYFDFVKNFVEEYYKLKMSVNCVVLHEDKNDNILPLDKNILSENTIAFINNMPIDDALKDYVTNKLVYESLYKHKMGYTQNYIDGSYDIVKWYAEDNILVCHVNAVVKFQYSDCDESSLVGEVIQIAIKNPQLPIVFDWYNADPASFDSAVRGYGLDICDSTNLINNFNEQIIRTKSDEVLTTTTIAYNEMNCLQETGFNVTQNQLETTSGGATSKSEASTRSLVFDAWMDSRTRAVYYANYIVSNSATPIPCNSSYSYGSFTYDCTNFISHCMLAGNFSMKSGTNLGEDGWFYNSMSSRSSSWSGVNSFYRFVKNNTSTAGPKKSYINECFINPKVTSTTSSTQAKSGDIIQIKYNTVNAYGYPDFGHSTLVHRISDTSDIMITYRTSNDSKGTNVKLAEKYPPAPNTTSGSGGTIYRLIKIKYSGE